MLTFYSSTELEKLADRLLENLRRNPVRNPLKPETFVVQNHGIGQWLSLYMAQQEGIAANLEFEFPSERIWKLIRAIDSDIPQNLPSDRKPMTWSLMEVLGNEKVLSNFENLDYYIRAEDPEQREIRRWKLCSRIADVFDQYLVYRPDLILDWQHGELQYDNEAEKWQSRLWNKLVSHWERTYEGRWLHRAELQRELLRQLENDRLSSTGLPGRLSVFGVSNMPPAFIQILVKLSELIDVCFYQLSLDHDIEDHEDFQNPLLQSLAKEGTEFISLFNSYSGAEKHSLEAGHSVGASVFKEVQSDLKNDSPLKGRNLKVPAADSSISVHSCHSPMREIEVLYDQLLLALDENPELDPDDILIMTPDIDTYAPMIEAVFDTPDEGQPQIPYGIADRGIEGASPAIDAFLSILGICESRFGVTEVLDLLDATPIQEAFEFAEDELNRLERWIRDNRIRWGIDGSFKEKKKLPANQGFTWKAGLNRMLLGYAMRQRDDKLYDGIYPYGEIDTSDDAELAGRLSHFLNELFELSSEAEQTKPAAEWAALFNRTISTFLPDNREYYREISGLREALEDLKAFAELGGFQGHIPFSVVRSWLQDQLENQKTGGGRIGKGVTFSSLMPMRSIPFSFIGMIGMNEGAFPRSRIPIEFDLMHLEPREGDPVRSEEDRFLFLDNILSARDTLYFSYVGQSNRQDSDFPPSVVLREFLDYLEQHYGLNVEDLVTRHRLQSFSPDYFLDKKLTAYSENKRNISRKLLEESSEGTAFMKDKLEEADPEYKQLSVNDLVSFFQHPAKYLLQKRLGIFLNEEEILTEDREPFELSGLDNYKVGQELLDRFIKEKPVDEFDRILKARDMLPEGWSGEQAYQQKADQASIFASHVKKELNQRQLDEVEVDMKIEEFRIVGTLSNIFEGSQISYRFGSTRSKDLIDLWIRHLLFQEIKPEGHSGYSRLFTRNNKKPVEEHRLSPVKEAQSRLSKLLDMYWEGMRQCIYFFPDSSHAFGKEICLKNGSVESGLSKADTKWIREFGSYPGEGEDPYNKLLLGDEYPLRNERFQEASERFWIPFFNSLEQGGG